MSAIAPLRPAPAGIALSADQLQLGRAIARKVASPGYIATRPQGRIPSPSFMLPEEQAVRQARDKLAFARQPPPGALALVVPRAGQAPQVDGTVGESEWRGALRIPLAPAGRRAAVAMPAPSQSVK